MRIKSINVNVVHAAAPTPLEVHITIDGIAYAFTFNNPVSTTEYFCVLSPERAPANQLLFELADYNNVCLHKDELLQGKSVQVLAEITGAGATALNCRVRYERLE